MNSSYRLQTCEHVPSAMNTVSFPSENWKKYETICEDCYLKRRDQWVQDRFDEGTFEKNKSCEICQRSPSRYDEDFGCNFCRFCIEENQTATNQIMEGRKGILPPFENASEIVSERIYLGPFNASISESYFDSMNIQQILVCCTHLPEYHHQSMKYRYHRIPIYDSLSQELNPLLLSIACDFIDEGIAKNVATLIHCHAGVSRSASITIAWLMRTNRWTFDQAYEYVKEKRRCISPNTGFERQLKEWETFLQLSK